MFSTRDVVIDMTLEVIEVLNFLTIDISVVLLLLLLVWKCGIRYPLKPSSGLQYVRPFKKCVVWKICQRFVTAIVSAIVSTASDEHEQNITMLLPKASFLMLTSCSLVGILLNIAKIGHLAAFGLKKCLFQPFQCVFSTILMFVYIPYSICNTFGQI